jgi:hypothetical protein
MTRRTATLTATAALLLLGCYVAWCGQSFYLKPRIVFPEWMPADVMEALPDAAEKAGLMEPEEFSMEQFARHLCRPHEAGARDEISAFRSEPDMIVAGRSGPDQLRSIYFVWKMVRWEMMTEEQFFDSMK